MAAENLGEEAKENEPKGGAEPTGAEPADPKPDGSDAKGAPDDGIKDSHGQPGINKERHDKEVADLKAEIAKLKSEAADASEAKAKREEYTSPPTPTSARGQTESRPSRFPWTLESGGPYTTPASSTRWSRC